MNEPSGRDSGLRRVSLVTKWVAAAAAALTVAFAVHAASDNPGRTNPASGATASASDDGSAAGSATPPVPGPRSEAPVSRHTTTGGS